MKLIDRIINSISFTPDCQRKWDFDGTPLVISSRGYDRDHKSFYVGYYLVATYYDGGGYDTDVTIIEDELFDDDFDMLKVKVKQWYKDHFIEALEKAIELLKKE